MRIHYNDIYVYYICPDKFIEKAKSIQSVCDQIGFINVKRVSFNELGIKPMVVTRAHLTACDEIISANKFPALIFEDDCKIIKPFPEYLEIPECDIMYLGAMTCRLSKDKKVYLEDYDKYNYRIYYSLGSHAMLFPQLKNILKYRDITKNSSLYHDVCLAKKSKELLFLTPKDGVYFYQSGSYENITKFEWKDLQKLVKK